MSTYAMDQERRFEKMMQALENAQQQGSQQLMDVDPEVEAFVNGIAYSLQKTTGQQWEKLFIDICQLVYDSLFPHRATAPHPFRPQAGAKPHVTAFRPPCPVSTPSVPTAQGDQNQFGQNWVLSEGNQSQGEFSHTLQYTEL